MDFRGAGLAHETDQRLGRRPADDRVVDDHYALPADHARHGIVFDFDAEVADRLTGLNEGATDVMVTDQTELEREPADFRVSESRGVTGVGDREDAVGVHRTLAGELPAE